VTPGIPDVVKQLTAAERRELDRLLLSAPPQRLPPGDFRAFIARAIPTYQFWDYIKRLITICERIVSGELRRVIIEAPVRHGKSVLLSRLLPAYFLRRRPTDWVALSSYSSDIAHINSRLARTYYEGQAGTLDVEAIKHWETGQGGGLWATGVGGPATGKGFHLGVIDDPIKDAKEAQSELIRMRIRDWFDATFYSRQEPAAAIVVTMARWHEQDLVGDLLERESENPERWHVVHWPALAEPWPEFPASCTIEPDAAREDQALCAARYPREELERRRARVGNYWFAALWQQRPQPREGGYFKRAWFPIVDVAPPTGILVRGWDQAATQDAGDYTAGVLLQRAPDGVIYVRDVERGQWDAGMRDRRIRATAERDGRQVRIQGEQEPGAAGKDAKAAFARLLEGYIFGVKPASGEKTVKAGPFAAQAEAGNVRLVKGPWNRAYLDELTSFPTGRHDDQVDATAIAYNALVQQLAPGVKPMSLTQVNVWQ
jgi:predicted phage terminase large subunit-like protein